MADETSMSDPVYLSEPFIDPPEPVAGCGVCGVLYKDWRYSMAPTSPGYDPSHASDVAVEIRDHPHTKRVLTCRT